MWWAYTANTMSSAIEALGMSLLDSLAQLAVSEDKKAGCRACRCSRGEFIEKNIRPRDIMTRKSIWKCDYCCHNSRRVYQRGTSFARHGSHCRGKAGTR